MPPYTYDGLIDYVRGFAAEVLGDVATGLEIALRGDPKPFHAPIAPAGRQTPPPATRPALAPAEEKDEDWMPCEYQFHILALLEGRALKSDPLAAELDKLYKWKDRSRLWKDPGGLHELRRRGLVKWVKKLGFYSADCPPPELSSEGE